MKCNRISGLIPLTHILYQKFNTSQLPLNSLVCKKVRLICILLLTCLGFFLSLEVPESVQIKPQGHLAWQTPSGWESASGLCWLLRSFLNLACVLLFLEALMNMFCFYFIENFGCLHRNESIQAPVCHNTIPNAYSS